jgi:vitamin B12/bleomycin/antimicrobial peptide transport system ATP-binding/permease protein
VKDLPTMLSTLKLAAVAAAALVALANGALGGGVMVLVLAAVGGLLALAILRSGPLSSFLKVLLTVFAFEYAATTVAHVMGKIGWWPEALKAITIPQELPLTVGLFGLIVYAVSFIPVVRTITGLADPYFAPENTKEANLWFNALQNKDQAAFWSLLLTVFLFWAMIFVISNLIEYFVENVLKIRWREYLVERYGAKWLGQGAHYRMGFAGQADNPDQRIAEDTRGYINNTYAFSISLISTLSNLVSFSIILWSIPAQFTIPGTEIVVPGLPFIVALLYAVIGTWLTHLIGKPLIKLDFNQEKYEADFRYSLARLREYSEQVALLRGETAERQHIGQRFTAIVSNYYGLVKQNLKLNSFVSSYFQLSVVFPYIIMAPAYFAGKLTLGQLTQTAGAFGRVEGSMQWFIARYASLANYKAIVDRLTTFQDAIGKANGLQETSGIRLPSQPGSNVTIPSLALDIPTGQTIVRLKDLTLNAGQSTLLTGPSGSGKSTLFRAIAGIWPYGKGDIGVPDGKSVMLLPQRPYLPMGTLRDAVQYPGLAGLHTDDEIRAALVAARLPKLVDRLDEEAMWAQVLSLGEQQRLAVARALLSKPDWLFLDEATAALDETTEAAIYAVVKKELPNTTVVSIGHRSTLIAMHDRRIDLQAAEDGIFHVGEVVKKKARTKA